MRWSWLCSFSSLLSSVQPVDHYLKRLHRWYLFLPLIFFHPGWLHLWAQCRERSVPCVQQGLGLDCPYFWGWNYCSVSRQGGFATTDVQLASVLETFLPHLPVQTLCPGKSSISFEICWLTPVAAGHEIFMQAVSSTCQSPSLVMWLSWLQLGSHSRPQTSLYGPRLSLCFAWE